MADAASQLQEAYELIESGDLQSARQLLEEIKYNNENNPDFWWIYAHALEDETEGRQALERVAQLAPNYPDLDKVFIELGMTPPQAQTGAPASAPPPPPIDAPSTEDVDEFHEAAQLTTDDSGNNWFVYAGVVTVVVLILAFLLFNSLTGNVSEVDETPTDDVIIAPTAQPIIPTVPEANAETVDETESVDVTPTVVEVEDVDPTQEPATEASDTTGNTETAATSQPVEQPTNVPTTEITEEESGDSIIASAEQLAIFSVPADGITLETTETFGDSYVIVTCSPLGPIATQNIVNIIDTLGDSAEAVSDTVGGFAFRVTDCDTDTITLTLGFDIDTLNDYWAGEINQSQLQQNLQRVNS